MRKSLLRNRRLLLTQALESRQMLAGDCFESPDVNGSISMPVAEGEMVPAHIRHKAIHAIREHIGDQGGQNSLGLMPENVADEVGLPEPLPFVSDILPYYGGEDLVQQVDGEIFVVSQSPYWQSEPTAKLYVLDRSGEGDQLQVAHEYQVDFYVEQMHVSGDQVLLIAAQHNWLNYADGELPSSDVDTATNGDEVDEDELPSRRHHVRRDAAFPEWDFQTRVATVSIGSDAEPIEQRFEGILRETHHDGNKVTMVLGLNEAVIQIYPPPPATSMLRKFEIGSEGLIQIAEGRIAAGVTRFDGNEVFVVQSNIAIVADDVDDEGRQDADVSVDDSKVDAEAERVISDIFPEPHHEVRIVAHRYAIQEGEVVEQGSLRLGVGYVGDVLFDLEAGKAVVTGGAAGPNVDGAFVSLVDLSGDTLALFENVRVGEYAGRVVASGNEYVVLRDFGANDSLVIVDTNLSIDLAAENRVQRVELPEGVSLGYGSLELADGKIVMFGHRELDEERRLPPEPAGRIAGPFFAHESVLLTLSIREAAIIATTPLTEDFSFFGPSRLFAIDAEDDRFGFIANPVTGVPTEGSQIIFGKLVADGKMERMGAIGHPNHFIEIDANPNRLLVREANRLVYYPWEDGAEPSYVVPIPNEEIRPIVAVDDEYTIYEKTEDHVLNVLANDQIGRRDRFNVSIVELIDAPEGSQIVNGWIVIPHDALVANETIEFGYRISDGVTESEASVSVTLKAITDEQVERLVELVKQQASEDLDVPVDLIEVTSVERVYDSLPVVLPPTIDGDRTESDDRSESDDYEAQEFDAKLELAPGILVTLSVPNGSALYAASLEGRIVQVFAYELEHTVRLGLRASDIDGGRIEEVAVGETFYLDFVGKDLREEGLGIYSAFLDLQLPEGIELTGEVRYGEGFGKIASGEVSDSGIKDFGALGNQIASPGNRQQTIIRFEAVATRPGSHLLQPTASEGAGTGTLVRGENEKVAVANVRYDSLTLLVTDVDQMVEQLDNDGNGIVTANDALQIINYLGINGNTVLPVRSDATDAAEEGQSPLEQDVWHEMDANRDNQITALDALVIINYLYRYRNTNPDIAGDGTDDDENDAALLAEQQESRLF